MSQLLVTAKKDKCYRNILCGLFIVSALVALISVYLFYKHAVPHKTLHYDSQEIVIPNDSIKTNIDEIREKSHHRLEIKGWSLLFDEPLNVWDRKLLLKGENSGDWYECFLEQTMRKDVAERMQLETKRNENYHYDASGFQGIIWTSCLPKDTYHLFLLNRDNGKTMLIDLQKEVLIR